MYVHNKLKYISLLLVAPLLLGLAGCTADPLSPDNPDPTPLPNNPEGKEANCFIAFRIYMPGDNQTRATHDSDSGDKPGGQDNFQFNKGLEFERALYVPPVKKDPKDDNEEETYPSDEPNPQLFHFAILFNSDGTLLKGPIKLDMEIPGKDEDYYTVYTRFYDPSVDEDIPFREPFEGTVYVVLNASYDLQEKVETALNQTEDNVTALSRLLDIQLSSSTTDDFDSFLYLKDKKGQYILDDDKNRYFTMSSSIIINNTSKKSEPAMDGDFTFYNNEEEARQNAKSLYVERLQAKYTVLFKKGDYLYYLTNAEIPTGSSEFNPKNHLFLFPPENDQSKIKYVYSYYVSETIDKRNEVSVKTTNNWKVNVLGWGINALEPDEYLFKKIQSDATYYTGWNKYGETVLNFRNFWAEDPHYDSREYPDQYRKALIFKRITDDKIGLGPDLSIKDYSMSHLLSYYDFKELSNKEPRKYVSENTFDPKIFKRDAMKSREHLRAGSHLIVTAQLLIDGEDHEFEYVDVYESTDYDQDGLVTKNSLPVRTKFLMNDIYWAQTAYMNYVSEYLGYWMLTAENQSDDKFGPNDGCFYVNHNGVRADAASFMIEQAEVKGGDAMVWVKPKVPLYIKNPATSEFTPLDPDLYEQLAYEHPSYMAQRLLDGRMYYSIGSVHNLSRYNINNTNILVGDYGTVRNNWYYFTIDGITLPGTPVSVVEQKIIPNNEPEDNGMGVSLKLLDWHYEFAEVDVKDQNRPGSNN